MKTTEDRELARKIAVLLDRGNENLRQGTAYRLQKARQAALARMAEAGDRPLQTAAPALAAAGVGTLSGGHRMLADFRVWLGLVVLVVGIAYVYDDWSQRQQASEIAELDSALLGSDLPVDAFLDKGFENWLKRSGQ